MREAARDAPTRRAVTLIDERGERTITTLGARLQPHGDDPELPWSQLAACVEQLDAEQDSKRHQVANLRGRWRGGWPTVHELPPTAGSGVSMAARS